MAGAVFRLSFVLKSWDNCFSMETGLPHVYDVPPDDNGTINSSHMYEYVCQRENAKIKAQQNKERLECCGKRKCCLALLLVIIGLDVALTVSCIVLVTKTKGAENTNAQGMTFMKGNISNILADRLHANPPTNNFSILLMEKVNRISDKIDYFRKVRLVGGSTVKQGRVEILHNSEWGTICDDDWGQKEGDIVCEMLGFAKAIEAPTNARFGPGKGRIWLDQVACTGIEARIEECIHDEWGQHNCKHEEDASVICE